MMIDTTIYIHLSKGEIIKTDCNYNALLNCLKDEEDYIMTLDYIIPKIEIDYIETKKIESEEK